MQSDPQEEFDEILLKARAPMAAIAAGRDRQRPTRGLERRARAARAADARATGGVSEARPAATERAGARGASRRPRRALGVRAGRAEDVPAVAAAVRELLVELGGDAAAARRDARPARARRCSTRPRRRRARARAERGTASRSSGCWRRAGSARSRYPGATRRSRTCGCDPSWRGRGVGASWSRRCGGWRASAEARVEVGLPRESFARSARPSLLPANGFERLGPRMRRTVS